MAEAEASTITRPRATLAGHLAIARIDHWFKNVFVLPGIVVALSIAPGEIEWAAIAARFAWGLAAICLVASSNYVINELLDAPFDRLHPTKRSRPVPAGEVLPALAIVQWLALAALGLGLAARVGAPYVITMAVLWGMGCVYNIRPLRAKDLPYVDVLSESVNNPLRMLAGWYIVRPDVVVPSSALLSYWMVGCYFMAMKRLAEYVEIGDPARAAAYRKSFAFYTRERLLVSIMFYGSAAMLFFGAFIMRYRLELVLSFPLVALVMANYLSLSFKRDSAVQAPEKLYREPTLMASVIACALVMGVLMLVNLPWVNNVFSPGSAAFERLAGVDVNGPAEDGP